MLLFIYIYFVLGLYVSDSLTGSCMYLDYYVYIRPVNISFSNYVVKTYMRIYKLNRYVYRLNICV